jgi:hypothetical protein
MIASDADKTALTSPAARERRDDLDALLSKNGLPATVTEVADFASILRRRLFDSDPASEVLTATAAMFRPSLDDKSWTKNVWDPIFADWRQRWDEHVAACYPFHPMLMAMAKEEWSKVTGFQRVRSTIRIFAATVFAQQQRGKTGEWVPALIGPGDLPLSDSAVREALLGSGLVEDERTISNYRSLAEIEVVNNDGTGGTARQQDLQREPVIWSPVNPRAAERAATYVFLTSIVGTLRPGRGRGASAPEVKAATNVPEVAYTVTDADEVVDSLMNPDRGMSAIEVIPGQGNNKPARYFLSTRLTHRMLVNNIRRTITESERDEVIALTAQRLSNSGPFRDLRFVSADLKRTPSDVLATASLDTAYMTRLIVLDPTQFSLRNGAQDETLDALRIAMGLGPGTNQIPVQWASSAVFAVINTQRRALTRNMAVEYLARQKALAAPEVQKDAELRQTGNKELAEAKNKFEGHLKRAYQHVIYLAQPDPDGERLIQEVTFSDEHSSALDGTIVWKALAERDKVFDDGQFTARALVHNLRESDYDKTLSDIRAAFYSAPRLPLLYNGDRDLQQAIYDAVADSMAVIVDGAGQPVAVTAASHVNLSSTGLRLVKPQPTHTSGTSDAPGQTSGGSGDQPSAPASGATSAGTATASPTGHPTTVTERQISFSLTQNLLSNQSAADDLANLFKALYTALDERDVSYAQTTVQLVGKAALIDSLRQKLDDIGVHSTTKDM